MNTPELSQSQLRYDKIAEKAMMEMSQYTSDDMASVKMKKREHIVKSLKKQHPRQSNRLENMLKNAALNCSIPSDSESVHMTPMERPVPEQYSVQQPPMQQPYEYIPQQQPNFDTTPNHSFLNKVSI